MQLTLVQFLGALLTPAYSQAMSVDAAVVTLENGDTFDVKENLQSLQTLLMSASHDLKDAHEQLVQFSSNQPADTPYYNDTREKLLVVRRGIEALAIGTPPARAPVAETNVKVSTDGGLTYQPAPDGVRIIYSKVNVPGEDGTGELYISASSDSVVTDVWTTRETKLEHNIGSSCESTSDIVARFVKENRKSKRFQAVWGNDYHVPGKRKVGSAFFLTAVGYTDADRAAIDALKVGEEWRSSDGTNHTVTRIS